MSAATDAPSQTFLRPKPSTVWEDHGSRMIRLSVNERSFDELGIGSGVRILMFLNVHCACLIDWKTHFAERVSAFSGDCTNSLAGGNVSVFQSCTYFDVFIALQV